MQEVTGATTTRTERLVDELRLEIVTGRLAGGTRLTEEGLAERYQLSRTPVREALRLLAREALLAYTPRSGYVVSSIDLDEMEDLYAVRIAIESQSALRLVNAPAKTVIHDLLAFWGELPSANPEGDMSLVFADENFHESLVRAGSASVLAPMLETINRRLHPLRIRDFIDPARVSLTYQQHAAILRALLDCNGRLAAALLHAHIWESHANVRARFLSVEGDGR